MHTPHPLPRALLLRTRPPRPPLQPPQAFALSWLFCARAGCVLRSQRTAMVLGDVVAGGVQRYSWR